MILYKFSISLAVRTTEIFIELRSPFRPTVTRSNDVIAIDIFPSCKAFFNFHLLSAKFAVDEASANDDVPIKNNCKLRFLSKYLFPISTILQRFYVQFLFCILQLVAETSFYVFLLHKFFIRVCLSILSLSILLCFIYLFIHHFYWFCSFGAFSSVFAVLDFQLFFLVMFKTFSLKETLNFAKLA